MNFWNSLAGGLQIEMKCADPSFALTKLQERGISLYEVRCIDDFTVCFTVSRFQLRQLKVLAQKRGFEIRITENLGIYWYLPRLLRRPVLLVGLAMLFLVWMLLPTRVLFVQVEGNFAVPTRLILETAAQCGIKFGASRAEVRSERMKNALLERMPQLQWAGINTSGCVAVISVRERQTAATTPQSYGVASIVASRDGVITSITATKGNPLCKVGQAVKAGQTLISGYTDCGFVIRAGCAEGEIYAKTEREISLVTQTSCQQRGSETLTEKKYGLIIGKKRINLYFGSGISDSSCVKMYKENYITLPGGFQLPIAIVTEVWTQCVSEDIQKDELDNQWLSDAAKHYLTGDMIAGQILTAKEDIFQKDGICVLQGHYACLEMIGQLREEEIVKPNGTND